MVAQARFRTAAKLFTIFHFCGPQKPLYASWGGACRMGGGDGWGGWVTVSLRGLRYSEKACNFPQFRREFAHTSPTRLKFEFLTSAGGRAHSISRKAEHFSEFSISLSLELYISFSLAN